MGEDKIKQTTIIYLYPKRCKWYEKYCVVNNDKVDDKIIELKMSDCKILSV